MPVRWHVEKRWTLSRSRCESDHSSGRCFQRDGKTGGIHSGETRCVRILLLQVGSGPDVVVAAAVIEVNGGLLAAVFDDSSDCLPIRMTEMIAVRRQQVMTAIQQLEQIGAEIVLAAMVRNLECVDLEPLDRKSVV